LPTVGGKHIDRFIARIHRATWLQRDLDRRLGPFSTAPGPRPGRPVPRPERRSCAGSGGRGCPGRRCRTGRDASGSRSAASRLRHRQAGRPCGAGPALRKCNSASSGSSRRPPVHALRAAGRSPSIWWQRAIRANNLRAMESVGADLSRLRRRFPSAAGQSWRSTAIEVVGCVEFSTTHLPVRTGALRPS